MSITLPVIRGQMGIHTYYVATMSAQDATLLIKMPSIVPGWNSIEARAQRTVDSKRVEKGLYPYLTNKSADRFFGSLIVGVQYLEEADTSSKIDKKKKKIVFEPIEKYGDLPVAYDQPAERMGILTIKDSSILVVPYDGQHRLLGLRYAIEGRKNTGDEIRSGENNLSVAKDIISVILLPYSVGTSRNIFTKLNRYSKPTSATQNYITDDDDSIASIARKITNTVINQKRDDIDLVNWISNSLKKKDGYFTTLDTIYKCTKAIIEEIASKKILTGERLKDELERKYFKAAKDTWEFLLKEIDEFKDALKNRTKAGDENRMQIREYSLLGKPVPQQCIVEAFLKIIRDKKISKEEAVKRLNKIPWDIGNPLWDSILWQGDGDTGKILTKGKKIAIDLVSYMCGATMTTAQESNLLARYEALLSPDDNRRGKLPNKLNKRS